MVRLNLFNVNIGRKISKLDVHTFKNFICILIQVYLFQFIQTLIAMFKHVLVSLT